MARSKPKPTMSSILKMVMPESKVNTIFSIFDFIEIAEEELADEEDVVAAIAFMLLQPPEQLLQLQKQIYQHYCRELIERVKAKQNTQWGTKAEIMLMLRDTSLVAPLRSEYACLYSEIFNEIFPEKEIPSDTKYDYPEQRQQLINECANKTKQEWRK